jgi:hypothetical protein
VIQTMKSNQHFYVKTRKVDSIENFECHLLFYFIFLLFLIKVFLNHPSMYCNGELKKLGKRKRGEGEGW